MILMTAFVFAGCQTIEDEFTVSDGENLEIPDGSILQVYWNDAVVWVEVDEGLAVLEEDIVLGNIEDMEIFDGVYKASAGRATQASLWSDPQNIDFVMWDSCFVQIVGDDDDSAAEHIDYPEVIRKALVQWEEKTDGYFHFVEHSYPWTPANVPAQGWIQFKCGPQQCRAFTVGNYGAVPHLIEAGTCDDVKDIVHEVGHIIGLFHEHQRRDRDQNVVVNWQNIPAGKEINYRKYEGWFPNGKDYGPFDFNSRMMYKPDASYCNGGPCLEKLDGSINWSPSAYLTETDLYGMARRYTDSWYSLDRSDPEGEFIDLWQFGRLEHMDEDLAVGRFCTDNGFFQDSDDVIRYFPGSGDWFVYCDGGTNSTLWNNIGYAFDEVGKGNFSNGAGENQEYTDFLVNDAGSQEWWISKSGNGNWQPWNGNVTDAIETVTFGTFCGSSVVEGVQDAIHINDGYWEVSCSASSPWVQLVPHNVNPINTVIGYFNNDDYSDFIMSDGGTSLAVAFGGPGGSWYTPYQFYTVETPKDPYSGKVILEAGFTADDLRVGDFDGDDIDDIAYIGRDVSGRWGFSMLRSFRAYSGTSLEFNAINYFDSYNYSTLEDLSNGDIEFMVGDFGRGFSNNGMGIDEMIMRIESDI